MISCRLLPSFLMAFGFLHQVGSVTTAWICPGHTTCSRSRTKPGAYFWRQSWRHEFHGYIGITSSSHSHAGDDPIVNLPLMESQLVSIKLQQRENNSNDEVLEKQIQELETSIADAKTAAEFGVRRTQLQFYEAFSTGDLKAMDATWSLEHYCRCIHPAMASIEGREAVMASWEQILTKGEPFRIQPANVRMDICGQTAICNCIEETAAGGKLECVNIYKREDSGWRMTFHMASPIIVEHV